MVRSTSSCFKIITCSSDSIEEDDLERVEKKGTTDQRRWSFRKTSDRHQVLSNTVMLEALPTGNKENSESPNIDFKAQTSLAVPEKTSESLQRDELKSASHAVSSKALSALMATENTSKGEALISTEKDIKGDNLSATDNTSKSDALSAIENTSKDNPLSATANTSKGDALIATESSAIMDSAVKFDSKLDESVAIVIQAAIRGYLSQRALLKLKNVIKLQAAFRGHLLRRQAVGTLRCVQAIIKMQALVRARRARMFIEGPVTKEKFDEEHESNEQSGKTLVRGGLPLPGTDAKSKFYSNEKLLGNGFARKLLETVPKKKPIRIKCDPLRPDSAWKWLERWVSVSPSDFAQPQKAQAIAKNEEYEEREDRSASGLKDGIPTEIMSKSIDSKSIVGETEVEDEKNLITYDEDKFDFQFCPPAFSTVIDDPEKPLCGSDALSEVQETTSDVNHNKSDLQLDTAPNKMLDPILGRSKTDNEQPTHSITEVASESVMESKKVGFGFRKVSNPAFAAAQSKFEELSSRSPTGRLITSTHHDTGIEMNLENVSPSADSLTSMKLTPTDNSVSDDNNIHVGSVEFGAGVSVPFTLDLPETSEVVGEQKEHSEEAKEVVSDLNATTENASNLGHLDDEAKQESTSSQTNPSYSASDKAEKPGAYAVDSTYANEGAFESALAKGTSVDSTYANGEVVASDYANGKAVDAVYANGGIVDSVVNLQVGKETERSVSDLQNHIKAPESNQIPPSTKSSVKSKKKKLSRKERKQNGKSWSEDKKSPSNPTPDSAGRKSTEQTPKDLTNGRRRISFDVTNLEHGNQESGDNNSSNSLPSYMQATESARAKAYASSSPKSSPDVQDSELYIKKRHSLPSANGKQGSARMQSSTPPQVQHGSKGQHTNASRFASYCPRNTKSSTTPRFFLICFLSCFFLGLSAIYASRAISSPH